MERKLVLTGGIPSKNVGEEFIRVDEIGAADEFGFINRKTGFLPVAEGKSGDAIKAISEGKRNVKMGSQTRNGVFNVTLIDPNTVSTEVAGAASNAEVLLTHTA